MRYFINFTFAFIITQSLLAQNVGIGTTTPRGPLSFGGPLGQKIILWDDGNAEGRNYGIGIQSFQLQIHTDNAAADIVLGTGSSANLVERMRVKGNGNVGIGVNNPTYILDVGNRMRLRSGGVFFQSPGIYLNRIDNASEQGFMGIEDDNWMGFYSGSAGWSFGMNTSNGYVKAMNRLGIGTTTPNAPLGFPAALGKKITLYPGATGDVGLSVQGNLLQIYSDNPNADIAFGYDQAGTMTERFRMKANGAFVVNGNTGNSGQVLQSNGNSSPTWVTSTNALYNNTHEANSSTPLVIGTGQAEGQIPGMSISFTTTGTAKVLVSYSIPATSDYCFNCGPTTIFTEIRLNGSLVQTVSNSVCNGCRLTLSSTKMIIVGAGSHTISIHADGSGPTGSLPPCCIYTNSLQVQVIPQ